MAIPEFGEIVIRSFDYLEEKLEVLEKASLQAFLKKIKKFREHFKVLKNKSDNTGNF